MLQNKYSCWFWWTTMSCFFFKQLFIHYLCCLMLCHAWAVSKRDFCHFVIDKVFFECWVWWRAFFRVPLRPHVPPADRGEQQARRRADCSANPAVPVRPRRRGELVSSQGCTYTYTRIAMPRLGQTQKMHVPVLYLSLNFLCFYFKFR